MIEVEHLTKSFPGRVAVSDVTFRVEPGEIVGFLGPNGAGKTTAMRCLTGFLPPSAGTARVAGFDVVTHSMEARAHLGYLPESAALYPEMRVREYLAYRARLEGLRGADVGKRVDEAIGSCLLEEVAGRKVQHAQIEPEGLFYSYVVDDPEQRGRVRFEPMDETLSRFG